MAAPTQSLKKQPADPSTVSIALPQPPAVSPLSLRNSSLICAVALFLLTNIVCATQKLSRTRSLDETLQTDWYTASMTGKTQSWWTAKKYVEQTPTPPVVLMGSSQMQCLVGTDAKLSGHDVEQTLDHRTLILSQELQKRLGNWVECFNASLGGSMISDRILTAKALFTPGRIPKLVVLGIAPRDFMDNEVSSPSVTEPFHFYVPHIGLDELGDGSFRNAEEKFLYELMQNIPVHNLINYIHPAQLEPSFLKAPTPNWMIEEDHTYDPFRDSLYALRPGSCKIPHLPLDQYIDTTGEYGHRYKTWPTPQYYVQLAYLDKFLTNMQKLGVKVLIVGMPLDEINRILLHREFWYDYELQTKKIAAKHNVVYCDLQLRKDYVHSDFVDGAHLNWKGGQKLAAEIAAVIASHRELVDALK